MLDIALIDHDLEQLAGMINRHYKKQRVVVAGALRHEADLKDSISNISHDLRTPLTVIIGHLQLLHSSDLNAVQSRRVETALHKAEYINSLIGEFYDLSILDASQIVPQKETLNFSVLLIDFIAENAPLIESSNIKPEIILPDHSVFIYSDRNMIERILQNLLANAVRYSSGKIKICLTASLCKNPVLTIENTVKNESDLEVVRLFERFYTGDRSSHIKSTGLGLSVVKLLSEKLKIAVSAEMHSGTLSIRLHFKDCMPS